MAFFVVIFGIGVVACVQWRPPTDSLSDVDVHGVAEGPKEEPIEAVRDMRKV